MIIPLKKFLPGIAWFFVILVLICVPGSDLPKNDFLSRIFFDKWVHFGVFGLLVLLFCYPFKRSVHAAAARNNYFIKIAVSAAIYGIITELIQGYFIAGRSCDQWDIMADSAGALAGYLYCRKKFLNK